MSHLLRSSFTALLLALSALPAHAAPFPVAGTVQGVSLQEIASSLGPVTGTTHAGDNRLFITIRTGLISILAHGSPRPQPFLVTQSLTPTDRRRGRPSPAPPPRPAH